MLKSTPALACYLLTALLLACSPAAAEQTPSSESDDSATAQADADDQEDESDEDEQEASEDEDSAEVLEQIDDDNLVALAADDDDVLIGRGEGGMGLRGDGDSVESSQDSGRVGGLGEDDESSPGAEVQSGSQPAAPTTEIDEPDVDEHCDNENIADRFEERTPAVQHCYERQLQPNPELQGELTVEFRIEPDGSPNDVAINDSTVDDEQVEGCVERIVQRMAFSAPDDDQSCDAEVSMEFTSPMAQEQQDDEDD